MLLLLMLLLTNTAAASAAASAFSVAGSDGIAADTSQTWFASTCNSLLFSIKGHSGSGKRGMTDDRDSTPRRKGIIG